jgi:hypothetical protein
LQVGFVLGRTIFVLVLAAIHLNAAALDKFPQCGLGESDLPFA